MLKSTMPLPVFQKERLRSLSPTSFDKDPGIGPLKLFSPMYKYPSSECEEIFPISRGPLKSFLRKSSTQRRDHEERRGNGSRK
jgi:hypothetical protein|uniref:Uncharacterized protein n=1 Tax=Arabidopsis thaliana TaxID=3702 RepID=Q0WPP8_ARATH|nr:hypothetical protein [Arabidopsis thaliana]